MLHRLLSFLLNHMLFGSTMFFAAGTAVADVGAGDGASSSGDSSGMGDAGGEGVDNSSSQDSTGETTTDDDTASSADPDAVADPNALADIGNGQKAPAKLKKLFDAAKSLGLEKEIKQLYFANQRIAKAFGAEGVNGAIKLAQSVEALGGLEGIETLQGDLELHSQDAELFESNPQKWVENSFTENAEQSLKAWQYGLDLVAEKFPEQYDHAMARVMLDTLDKFSPIHKVYNGLKALQNNPEAVALAGEIAKWYSGIDKAAKEVPEKKVDARQSALDKREQGVTEKEMGIRYKEVNAEALPVMKTHVANTLKAEAKLKGLDLDKMATDYPGEFRSMMNDIQKSIMQTAVKDERFVEKYATLVKKGDTKRATLTLNQKHEKIIPGIVRTVAAGYGMFKGKAKPNPTGDKAKPGTSAGNADTGWARVSARPKNSEIDWSKTTSALQVDGKYFLNDGKKVIVQY